MDQGRKLARGSDSVGVEPRSRWKHRYRALVVPVAMGLLTVFLSLLLWRALEVQQTRLEQLATQSRQQSAVAALHDGMVSKVQQIEHVATRLGAVPQTVAGAVFAVDAQQYLHDIGSLEGIAYADAQRRLLDSRSRQSTRLQPGLLLDAAPSRRDVFEQADIRGGAQLSKPLTLLSGARGQLVVVPVRDGAGIKGYVIGVFRLDTLFKGLLVGVPANQVLRIRLGDQLIFSRGQPTPGAMPASQRIALYGQQWQVDVYPDLALAHNRTPQLVLLLGLVLGGLLTIALRLWALARERARLAEASSGELRAQISAREAMQVALADSERNMVTVLESITDGVFMVNWQWSYTYINPQAAQMLGANPAHLIGRNSLATFPANEEGETGHSRVHELWLQARRDNQPTTLETPLGPASQWYEMRVYPHELGLTVYLHDISARKRFEHELHKREAEHRFAQALAHLGSWELLLRSGELHLSQEACAIFGVERGSGNGGMDVLRCLMHPDDWPVMVEAQQRLYQGDTNIDLIYRITRPDGEERILHGIGARLQDNEDPIVSGCVQDITDQRAAQNALRKTSADLERALEATQLVMDSAPDVILVLDRVGRFLQVSAAARRLWGYVPKELLGESITRVIHPDDIESTLVAIGAVVGGTPNRDLRNRNIALQGHTLHMQWSAVWSEQSQCLYVVGRDHTELHRAEEMENRQRQILTAIAKRRPLHDVLEMMVAAYETHYPDALCSVLLLREGCLYRAAAPNLPEAFNEAINGVAIGPQVGSCGTAAWRGERVVVADIVGDPLWQDYAPVAVMHGLRACWSTPILARDGDVLGTFAVYYETPRAPLDTELEGLDTLAALAGLAIEHELAFDQLSESEQRFRSLFEQHPDAVFALAADGHVQHGNPVGRALLGLTLGQPKDAAFVQRFAVADQGMIRDVMNRAAAGEPARLNSAARDAAGISFPAHLITIPILVQGRPQGAFVVLQDQRALRNAQQRMASQLALISAIAECVGEGLVAVDELGAPTFLNHSASRLLGLVPGMLPVAADMPSALVTPLLSILGGVDRMSDDDVHVALAEGGALDVSYLATPLLIGGKLVGAVVAFRDIAEVKAARKALQQRNQFFELSMEVFCIGDPASGRFVQVNPAYARLLGYTEQAMLTMPYMDLLHPEDQLPTSEAIDRQLDLTQDISALVTRMRCADGSYRWLEWHSTLGPDGLLYGAARDTTQRLQGERALAQAMDDLRIRNRELQDFAYVASHDLQEPLRKIQTFSDRLCTRLASSVDESALDYLERMGRAALRMQTLIDDLLAYSRAGTSPASMTEVNLSTSLAMVLEDLELRIREAGASFDIGELPTIRANAAQMRQLLQNLLANALKFRAPQRPCCIRIHARDVRSHAAGSVTLWELRVEDNGIGFDAVYAERIFSPFQRLHPRNVYEGTGIGLAIVRRIAERHGGAVRAEGYTGQGSTFVVTLSSQPPADSAPEHGKDSFIDG